MKDNELIEILKEFDKKRVEQLNDNARKMFNAIMSIADERDRLLEEKQELIDYLKEEQLFYYNQYKCSKKLEDLKRYNRLINEYDKILSKIEKE